jgi:glutathione peroxidase
MGAKRREGAAAMPAFHEFKIASIEGRPDLLAQCRDKVVLAVNVASECGFTPQYEGLQALAEELADQPFVVVGFPCNQFGGQEPGSEADIQDFCKLRYGVTFPLSGKIDVNGAQRHPLYAWLTSQENGFPGDVRWNFEKFLIGRDGRPRGRYSSRVRPEDKGLLQDIADALG